jgi:ABC-type hemin transport system ATPase subunit
MSPGGDRVKVEIVDPRGRGCLDEVGCEELQDGDAVSLEGGEPQRVKLYRRDVMLLA